MTRIISITTLVLLITISYCQASVCCAASAEKEKPPVVKPLSEIDKILQNLNTQKAKIKTYQAKIDYLFIQDPELLDSRITRTGKIYYKKTDKASNLVIKFDTFKQDDEKKQKRKEEYTFDGVWLKIIDHKNKTVNSYQKAEKGKPVDAFELISRDFPMIGFSNKEDLRKDFDITIPKKDKNTNNKQVRLKLVVKKGSPYAKNYTSIDFRIDKKTYLPARIITTSTEGDIYDIKLHVSNINKNLKDTVFMLETPTDFRENKHPIKK
jgi:outer membrane lipoprotein-sorting protein